MNILAIDTSTNKLIVALKNNNEVIYNQPLNTSKHLEVLMPQIDEILSSKNFTLANINVLSVVVGPGSFTGIRIGVATAKAFCKVYKNLKVVGVNSLDLLAYTTITKLNDIKLNLMCVLPSTANKFYVGFYEGYKKVKPDMLLDVEQIEEIIKQNQYKVILNKDSNLSFRNAINFEITKDEIIDFTEYLISKNKTITSVQLVPYYLALSQAEEELLKKEGKNG